ncbi:unannotated protein [freshwater metagenome]|uniref:Unannotated protein n=1 Tax=freshwater metagenome TaxID=449393 RepID=A0A6J6AAT2_9ZZZZ
MAACGVFPVTAALHGGDVTRRVLQSLRAVFGVPGTQIVERAGAAKTTAPFAVLVITGGVEQQVLDAWHERQALVPGEPLLLLTHPEENSLPAALEVLARVQRDGGRGHIVMLGPDNAHHEFDTAVHALAVWHGLRRARVGMIGAPSEWLVASVPAPEALRRRWGPTLVEVSLPDVMERFEDNIEAPIAVPVRLAARPGAHSPHPADVETAARFEPVLRAVAGERHLDAVAVRCFDLISEAHTSGCLALSSLNDRGIIAGCEGDVASTIAML